MSAEIMEGWGFPRGSKKAHYFLGDGRSLCGRYGFYSGDLEADTGSKSSADCGGCRRQLERRQKAVR